MKKSHEICFEKKFSKYLFSKDLDLVKNKSKSPSLATATDSPESNHEKDFSKSRKSAEHNDTTNIFVPILNDENELFSFESKTTINEDFLSNIKQNHFFTMKLQKTDSPLKPSLFNSNIKTDSYVKISGKLSVNNNLSNFKDANINSNYFDLKSDISNNLFSNSLINADLYDSFLNSISASSSNSNSSSNIKNSLKNNSQTPKHSEDNERDMPNNTIYSLNNLSQKERIVIEALMELKKDNLKKEYDDIDSIDFDLEEYYINKKNKNTTSSFSSEEDSNFEKNVNEFIDKRIKLYYKNFVNSQPHALEEKKCEIIKFNNEIKKILLKEKEKKSEFCFIGFKSIVNSLLSLIIDITSHINFKIHLKKINNKEKPILSFIKEKNLLIFTDLLEKYKKIKDICPFIQKDFKDIIDNFQTQKKMDFSLCDLFTDFYWDHIFKINNINNKFINAYTLSDFNFDDHTHKSEVEPKKSMDEIIDILISCNFPYKKNLGEILNLSYIKNENIFLISYILDSKQNLKYIEPLPKPSLPKKNNENIFDNKNEEEKNNKNIKNININKQQKDNKEKITDNFSSLDELYNYIQGDNEQKGKKKSKKHKKKKKNKNDGDKNSKKEENIPDPVVEEFIQYFKDFNKKNEGCIKIKPKFTEKWLKSLC